MFLVYKKVSVAIHADLWYMFGLQGGEYMKNKLLEDLYDCFYSLPEFTAQKLEINQCRQTIAKVLSRSERRLVLQIIDAKDYIIENISVDSFISGFELAWKLFAELNHYENEHPVSCHRARELGARFIFKREAEI